MLSPVEYVIGAARALELFEPPCSTLMLAEWCGRLGQDLFYPPNVGGWPGGRSWLTTRSVIGRANFAAGLVEGNWIGRPEPLDASPWRAAHGENDVIAFYARLLLGTEPSAGVARRMAARLGSENECGRRRLCPPARGVDLDHARSACRLTQEKTNAFPTRFPDSTHPCSPWPRPFPAFWPAPPVPPCRSATAACWWSWS